MKKWFVGALLVAFANPGYSQSFVAEFSPAAGKVPTANNLLFRGSTDGTLNIPIADPATAPIFEALNSLDGFSTVAPITTTFSAAVDSATIVPGESVRIFEVTLVNPFLEPDRSDPFSVTKVNRELEGGVDFTAVVSPSDPTGQTLAIAPLRPLKPKTGYLVVLTDAIRSAAGSAPLPDFTYEFLRHRKKLLIDFANASQLAALNDPEAQQLEQLRKVIVSQENAAADGGVYRPAIVLSWTFMTQSITDVLVAAKAQAGARPIEASATGLSTAELMPGLSGLADVLVGSLRVPYYLEAPTAIPSIILATHWQAANGRNLTRYNPVPVATQELTIPLLVSVPNDVEKPATGWPVVIFQHGFTRNRSDLIFVADSLAAAGLAAVAIDLPLHGITDPTSPLYSDGRERTFNADLLNNTTGAPGADGVIDATGSHVINLTSLLTARDNLRQGAADLETLRASLADLDLDGDNLPDLDTTQVTFWGNSLGGIVGGVFVGLDGIDQMPHLNAASLTVTGGGIARLLEGSGARGPLVRASLEAVGIIAGTAAFDAYFVAAQQALDSTDPINFAVGAAATHPLHLVEIANDQVIPNSVAGAPLAGTEPYARVMGLDLISTSKVDENGIRGIVRILEGGHSSALVPDESLQAFLEIRSSVVAFLASNGTQLPVANPSLLVK